MLNCFYRPFWNTPEPRNMDRSEYFSDSALQIPSCSELTSKPQSDLVFQFIKEIPKLTDVRRFISLHSGKLK